MHLTQLNAMHPEIVFGINFWGVTEIITLTLLDGFQFSFFRLSETGRIRFRGVRLQTPNSVSFFGAH